MAVRALHTVHVGLAERTLATIFVVHTGTYLRMHARARACGGGVVVVLAAGVLLCYRAALMWLAAEGLVFSTTDNHYKEAVLPAASPIPPW